MGGRPMAGQGGTSPEGLGEEVSPGTARGRSQQLGGLCREAAEVVEAAGLWPEGKVRLRQQWSLLGQQAQDEGGWPVLRRPLSPCPSWRAWY